MDNGEDGHHGHCVEETARSQDPEVVIILLHKMEERIVLERKKIYTHALEDNVLLMENGLTGHHGQHVEKTARSQDPEVVIILLHKMEERIVHASLHMKI